MVKLIFGYEKFKDDGDSIDNCIDYVFNDWKICDCGNVFLGMFQKVRHNYLLTSNREWENLLVDTKKIDDIKGHYYYVINVREFSAALGIDRLTGKLYDDKHIFKYISPRVIDEVRDNKCKIIINYGYEGFGKKTNGGDTILYKPLLDRLHELLDEYKIPHNNVVYLDANLMLDDIVLDTKINYFSYEYTALDWERFTVMHPNMSFHGNSVSQKNLKRWKDSQSKIRKKFFLSFNRLPKQHRVDLVLSLEKYNFLSKGYVSFPEEKDFWKFETYNGELKPYEDSLFSKLPLKIDNIQLDKKKWSYEKFDNRFYLNSYFQIVAENQFTDYEDQLQFTEKTWKPITNFQPFILLGERYQLKKLKERGFKTFSPFIDESYDEVLDTKERFSMIEIEINKLCNRPIEEIHDWYWSIEQDLRHNYYHFYGKWVREQRNSLLNKLRIF
tara:strand:- start:3775 stop:5100 length:1326 start_codon:yes stop_codon:yes gene_type:complete